MPRPQPRSQAQLFYRLSFGGCGTKTLCLPLWCIVINGGEANHSLDMTRMSWFTSIQSSCTPRSNVKMKEATYRMGDTSFDAVVEIKISINRCKRMSTQQLAPTPTATEVVLLHDYGVLRSERQTSLKHYAHEFSWMQSKAGYRLARAKEYWLICSRRSFSASICRNFWFNLRSIGK